MWQRINWEQLAFAEFDGDLSFPGITQTTARGVSAYRHKYFIAVMLVILYIMTNTITQHTNDNNDNNNNNNNNINNNNNKAYKRQ